MTQVPGAQPTPPTPPSKMTLGQLWNYIMIKQYLIGQLDGYTISVQDLAPAQKEELDNMLARIDAITDEIKKIGEEMGKKPPASWSKAEEARHQSDLQAQLDAQMTDRSKVQVQVSTLQSSMQAVLQRGMAFLQQANAFIAEIGQIWNQMSGTMAG